MSLPVWLPGLMFVLGWSLSGGGWPYVHGGLCLLESLSAVGGQFILATSVTFATMILCGKFRVRLYIEHWE